jgi:hypothetical protein
MRTLSKPMVVEGILERDGKPGATAILNHKAKAAALAPVLKGLELSYSDIKAGLGVVREKIRADGMLRGVERHRVTNEALANSEHGTIPMANSVDIVNLVGATDRKTAEKVSAACTRMAAISSCYQPAAQLQVGMALVGINNQPATGLKYAATDKALKERPLTLDFSVGKSKVISFPRTIEEQELIKFAIKALDEGRIGQEDYDLLLQMHRQDASAEVCTNRIMNRVVPVAQAFLAKEPTKMPMNLNYLAMQRIGLGGWRIATSSLGRWVTFPSCQLLWFAVYLVGLGQSAGAFSTV